MFNHLISYFARARFYSAGPLFAALFGFSAGIAFADVPSSLEAARQLVLTKNPNAAARILDLAAAEKDPSARAAVVAVLGNLAAGRIAPIDLEPFVSDAEPLVRLEAVQVLGKLGGAKAARRLEAVLRLDVNAGVRLAAAFWLGGIKDPDSAKPLGDALAADADANVRAGSAHGLRRMAASRARTQLRRGDKERHPGVKKALGLK